MDDSSSTEKQSSPPRTHPMAVLFKIGSIQLSSVATPIVLQNDVGPCLLLAICNVLSLRKSLKLNTHIGGEISQETLLSLVEEISRDVKINTAFGIRFFFADIGEDSPTSEAVGSICEFVHSNDLAGKQNVKTEEEELISKFLTARQLTDLGGLENNEICVLFRNNHFSTMFKYEEEFYVLITDEGVLNQPGIVWEKLNVVSGNTVFCDSSFQEIVIETSEPTSQEQNILQVIGDSQTSEQGDRNNEEESPMNPEQGWRISQEWLNCGYVFMVMMLAIAFQEYAPQVLEALVNIVEEADGDEDAIFTNFLLHLAYKFVDMIRSFFTR